MKCTIKIQERALDTVTAAIEAVSLQNVTGMRLQIDAAALQGIKFVDILDPELAIAMLQARLSDSKSAHYLLQQQRRFIAN